LSTVNSRVALDDLYLFCVLAPKSATNICSWGFKIQTQFANIFTNYVQIIFARRQRITNVILHIL
jgi:hypothetical protein